MPSEYSGMRVTPIEVPGGIGNLARVDMTRVTTVVVAEMTRWGSGVGDISVAFGDMGDFLDVSPGDIYTGFFPVRRLRLRNNTAVAKKLVLVLHESAEFRILNTPRGV